MLKILNLARLLVLDGMSIPLNLKFPSQGFSILKFYFCGDKCHFWILQRIELEMDLRGLTCKKLKYFCVKLTADDPLPPFTLAKAVNGANIGCSRTKCKYYQMLDTVRGTTLSLPPHTPSPPLHQSTFLKISIYAMVGLIMSHILGLFCEDHLGVTIWSLPGASTETNSLCFCFLIIFLCQLHLKKILFGIQCLVFFYLLSICLSFLEITWEDLFGIIGALFMNHHSFV